MQTKYIAPSQFSESKALALKFPSRENVVYSNRPLPPQLISIIFRNSRRLHYKVKFAESPPCADMETSRNSRNLSENSGRSVESMFITSVTLRTNENMILNSGRNWKSLWVSLRRRKMNNAPIKNVEACADFLEIGGEVFIVVQSPNALIRLSQVKLYIEIILK